MYLPKINKRSIIKRRIDCFEGINRGRVAEESEFSDTCNLCSAEYPALSSMPKRYELDNYELPTVDTPLFFLNRNIYHMAAVRADAPFIYTLYKGNTRLLDVDFGGRMVYGNLTAFNSRNLFVRKDTAYEFDPSNPSAMGGFSRMGYTLTAEPKHKHWEYNERTLFLSVLYEDMSEPGSFTAGKADSEFPSDAEAGDLFAKHLEYYRLVYKDASDAEKNIWQYISSVRLRLDIGNGYRNFKKGDYVRLKDLKYWNWAIRHLVDLDRFLRIEDVDEEGRYITEALPVFADMDKILWNMSYPTNEIGYGDIIIDNTGNLLPVLFGAVSACMPSMDFICTGANRVWGCSNDNREIYASELGNARNFSVFEGLSGDSYAVTVGSEGDFTACCNYLGTPVFFKETEMIVVTGSRPASFTLNSYSVRGVPSHSPDGLCVAGDTLYYISNDGVYAYDGSGSVCISLDLGEDIKKLRGAVMCGEGDILYVSGLIDEVPVQYTYDIKRRIWHRASTERVVGYIKYPDATLSVTLGSGKVSINTLDNGIPYSYGLIGAKEIQRDWSWETGDISYSTDKKYLRKLSLDTGCEGECRLCISYDGEDFQEIGSFAPHTRASRRISVFPRRCDYFRLRMEGNGAMTLYALTKEIEEVRENG